MIIIFLAFFSVLLTNSLFAELDFNINTTLAYSIETNPLLRETSILKGNSYLLGGGGFVSYTNENIYTDLKLGTSYLEYSKLDNISSFSLIDFNIQSTNNIKVLASRDIAIKLLYKKSGDIVPINSPFLQYKDFKLNLSSSDLLAMWFLRPVLNFEYYNNDNKYFNRNLGNLGLETVSKLYPETYFIFASYYGWILHNNTVLQDALYLAFSISLDGRFTKTTYGGAKLNYKYLNYADGYKFSEPELFVWFKTMVSPKSFVKVVFEREAKDSFYSDFFLDTGFSLKTRTIFLDSWVLMLNADVKNRKYWNLKRRDIVFKAMLGIYYPIYSFKYFKNIAVFFKTNYSNKITDAYGLTEMNIGPDPAINYNNFRFLFGITNEY